MNKSILLFTLGVLLTALTIDARCQTKATLKGIVLDQNTSQPIIGAHIYLPDGKTGSASDENGFFQVTGLNPSIYTFSISAIGYETKRISVDLSLKNFSEERILMLPKTQEIDQLVISGTAQQKRTETNISVHHLDAKKIAKIPAYGATPDLVQYLQMLPGITFTGDQGGQLYIRGGSQSMNKFLVDGISLYNPIHSMGLFSVIDTDILQGADVYTGGFGAEFSGAIASTMDVRIRTGNMKKFNASVSVDPFQTSVLAEGPLVKKTESRNFSISYLLSGKQSLIDQTSSFYPHLESSGLPFSFRDFLGKVSLRGNAGDKLDVLVYNNADGVYYPGLVDMNWQSKGGGIQATIFPYQSKAQMHPYIHFSSYIINYQAENQKPSSSLINGFQAGLSYKYILGYDQVKYGIEVIGNETNTTIFNQLDRKIIQKDFTSDLRGFIQYKKIAGKFIIDGGLNVILYGSLHQLNPEPRLRIKYQTTSGLSLKLATGLYSQNLLTTHSEREIVNFFQGFLSSPEGLQTEYFGQAVNDRLQKARHAVFGLEFNPTKTLNMSSELYLMNYYQLINVNKNRYYEDNSENQNKPEYLRKVFIIEEGMSYGVDFQIHYYNKGVQLWTVYSYAKSSRNDEIMAYIPHYDRRHSVNFLFSYEFGKDKSWDFSTRWNMGTGLPFTQTQGFFEEIDPFDAVNDHSITRINGELAVLLAGYNLGRLPTYHRLDMSLKKSLYHKWGTIDIVASVINVYNRKNLFYVERLTQKRVNQLPILPTIGLKFRFL